MSDRAGNAVAYALQLGCAAAVVPGDLLTKGNDRGEHNRDNDIDVNPTKEKKLTNMRASGKDEAVVLTPVRPMTLEHALHFVREDELIEVTPHSIRLQSRAERAQALPVRRQEKDRQPWEIRLFERGREPFWRKVPLPPNPPPSSPKTFAFIESLFKCCRIGKKACAGLFRTGFLILVSG